MNNNYFIIILY